MSIVSKVIDKFDLANTKDGMIEVAIVKEPYGKDSDDIVSIGIFLNKESEEPNWKAHIPKDNLDAVIDALKKAKEEL